jgi:hypothetical protein
MTPKEKYQQMKGAEDKRGEKKMRRRGGGKRSEEWRGDCSGGGADVVEVGEI